MKGVSVCIFSLFLLIVICSNVANHHQHRHSHVKHHGSGHGYELPLFPPDLQPAPGDTSWNDSGIPRNVWIAVRNSTFLKPAHTSGLMARNKNWTFNFWGNDEKDAFMEKYFANSSILWIYNVLNPQIGCARPEIWRLAVLYKYGGIYVDDDADIQTPFDEIIRPADRFIIGNEDYAFDDRCFVDEYTLSNHSFNLRFGNRNIAGLLGGRFFFNWAMFSTPRHPILIRSFEHIRELITGEYLGKSLIKMHINDHRGKLLQCATTFSITHTTRELILENNTETSLGLRIGSAMFRDWGANMKAWNNDHAKDRWVKAILRLPYLREYAPPNVTKYEGKLIMQIGQREIYQMLNGTRHVFPDFGTFVAMGFDTGDVVSIPHNVIALIPIGDPLPTRRQSLKRV